MIEKSEFFAAHTTFRGARRATFAAMVNRAEVGVIDLALQTSTAMDLGWMVAYYMSCDGMIECTMLAEQRKHPNAGSTACRIPNFGTLGRLCFGDVVFMAPKRWEDDLRNLEQLLLVTKGHTASMPNGYIDEAREIVSDVCCACGLRVLRYVDRNSAKYKDVDHVFDEAQLFILMGKNIERHCDELGSRIYPRFSLSSYALRVCDCGKRVICEDCGIEAECEH